MKDSKNIGSSENDFLKGKQFWKTTFGILVPVLLLCFFIPWILTKDAIFSSFAFTGKGEIGDAVGGIVGPFIALVAAGLTFIAFWVQYQFNIKQNTQFKTQSKQISVDRFESKLFELIKIQRENLYTADVQGTYLHERAFEFLFYELEYCYNFIFKIIQKKHAQEGFNELYKNPKDILVITYFIFYFGISENTKKLIRYSIGEMYSDNIITEILQILNNKMAQDIQGVRYLPVENSLTLPNTYKALIGHQTYLGKYFRHLFNTVKYIAEQPEAIINKDEKRNYATTLRAQLSDFEQLLLYYDSITPLGREWNSSKNSFISDYRLIKNIPLPFASFGPNPVQFYEHEIRNYMKNGKSFFELTERLQED